MNPEDFVKDIKKSVSDAASEDLLKTLARPPGRRPQEELVDLSSWFNRLPNEDKRRVEQVIALATRHAVFGFLCVLDGSRNLANLDNGVSFELWLKSSGGRTLLNDPAEPPLHEGCSG